MHPSTQARRAVQSVAARARGLRAQRSRTRPARGGCLSTGVINQGRPPVCLSCAQCSASAICNTQHNGGSQIIESGAACRLRERWQLYSCQRAGERPPSALGAQRAGGLGGRCVAREAARCVLAGTGQRCAGGRFVAAGCEQTELSLVVLSQLRFGLVVYATAGRASSLALPTLTLHVT